MCRMAVCHQTMTLDLVSSHLVYSRHRFAVVEVDVRRAVRGARDAGWEAVVKHVGLDSAVIF